MSIFSCQTEMKNVILPCPIFSCVSPLKPVFSSSLFDIKIFHKLVSANQKRSIFVQISFVTDMVSSGHHKYHLKIMQLSTKNKKHFVLQFPTNWRQWDHCIFQLQLNFLLNFNLWKKAKDIERQWIGSVHLALWKFL